MDGWMGGIGRARGNDAVFGFSDTATKGYGGERGIHTRTNGTAGQCVCSSCVVEHSPAGAVCKRHDVGIWSRDGYCVDRQEPTLNNCGHGRAESSRVNEKLETTGASTRTRISGQPCLPPLFWNPGVPIQTVSAARLDDRRTTDLIILTFGRLLPSMLQPGYSASGECPSRPSSSSIHPYYKRPCFCRS